MLDKIHSSNHYHRRLTHIIKYLQFDQTPLALKDSSKAVYLHDNVESDLRVSFVNTSFVGPYSATVLIARFSLSPGSSTYASSVRSLNPNLHNNLRSMLSDLRVSLVNNGYVGPYSATVLVSRFSLSPRSSTSASSVRSLNPLSFVNSPMAALTAPSKECSCGNFPHV
ncbi:hypothetical protein TNCV_810911 [Trichonephila clavipes]|uniref:Uncharacterized protein n=1 Tax=Trichonephila clavipes TaxID=2585209 RepID=A0A8X6SKI3_TRICX|nr:hypothetical protein TNCV_810911 [Trichonephila clavipes]